MAKKAETVLITGASSGIGKALAWIFAAHGNSLVLVARGAKQLSSLQSALITKHHVTVTTYPADLSLAGSAEKLHQSLQRDGKNIDILVNNAGVLEQGAFTDISGDNHQRMIQLNVSGFTDMLHQLMPPMLERGHGRILNVASIAAFMPVPGLATYAATKAYVLSLSEALAEEARGKGVSVTVLCPGVTATNMFATAKSRNSSLEKMPGILISDVDEVARQAYKACMSGTAVVVPGSINWATAYTARAMPKWMVRRFNGLVGRRSTIKS